jgi:hypothetical protein
MRKALALFVLLHAAIHLLGVAKAFGLADLAALPLAIARPMGVLWLAAAMLLGIAAWAALTDAPWFWIAGGVGVVVSQVAILTAWHEAWAGTIANALVLVAVVAAIRSPWPDRLDRDFALAVADRLAAPARPRVLLESDLAPLPPPVQRYLRVTGSVGRAMVTNFRAVTHGRIRGGPRDGWMAFTAEQLNTAGVEPARLYLMHARKAGLPVTVFHRFVGIDATMHVAIADLIPLVDAAGPEMDRSETVTILNDLAVYAPAALVDPAIRWRAIDDTTAEATWTRGEQTVSATLRFAPSGELVDFWSDDRSALSADGTTATRMRWSTPLDGYRDYGGVRLASHGEGRWHAPDGTYTYIDITLDAIAFNVARLAEAPVTASTPRPMVPALAGVR